VDNRLYVLMLGGLGVWRLTHLINAEDGPHKSLARFRTMVGAGSWGELMDCFYCLSVWIAAPFAFFLGNPWREKLLLWPALSAAAILLERATSKVSTENEPIVYHEDPPPEGETS